MYNIDREFKLRVKRLPSGARIQAGTRYIINELIRPMLIDQGARIPRNHVIDLFHAVVPLAYCDIVLLDKHWETQADRMMQRLDKSNLSFPVAKVFSGKGDGLNEFIAYLEEAAFE